MARGCSVHRDRFRGFSTRLGALRMAIRPVSSHYEASDYYMNYYMRRPRFMQVGRVVPRACSPPSPQEDARVGTATPRPTSRVDVRPMPGAWDYHKRF